MRTLPILAFLPLLAWPLAAQGDKAQTEKVSAKEAASRLDKAFQQAEAAVKIEAIGAVGTVAEASVVHALGKGLKDKDQDVVKATIEALRFNPNPAALRELESLAKAELQRKEAQTLPLVFRAIGQHGKNSSIDILSKDLFAVKDFQVGRSRLLALGNIRSKESVEAVIGLMRIAETEKVQPFMDDFRLTLMVLTGADQGASQPLWIRWWNDNKNGLKVAEKPAALPAEQQKRWDEFWGKAASAGKDAAPKDAGQDPTRK